MALTDSIRRSSIPCPAGAGSIPYPGRSDPPKLFHLALRLEGEHCLVVGGGPVGARKATSLLECGAIVTVVAPQICDALETLAAELAGDVGHAGAGADGRGAGGGGGAGGGAAGAGGGADGRGAGGGGGAGGGAAGAGGAGGGAAGAGAGAGAGGAGMLALERRRYRPDEAAGYRLVVTATGRPEVDGAVYLDCRRHGVLVNAADDPQSCSFLVPAVLREGAVSVAVSTGGASPWLAGWVRRRVGTVVGLEVGLLAEIVGEARATVRRAGHSSERLDWGTLVDGILWPLVSAGKEDAARAAAGRWASSVMAGAGIAAGADSAGVTPGGGTPDGGMSTSRG